MRIQKCYSSFTETAKAFKDLLFQFQNEDKKALTNKIS